MSTPHPAARPSRRPIVARGVTACDVTIGRAHAHWSSARSRDSSGIAAVAAAAGAARSTWRGRHVGTSRRRPESPRDVHREFRVCYCTGGRESGLPARARARAPRPSETSRVVAGAFSSDRQRYSRASIPRVGFGFALVSIGFKNLRTVGVRTRRMTLFMRIRNFRCD